MEKNLINWTGIWDIKHIRKGKVIWEDTGKNSVAQQGEESILETYFRSDTITIWNQYQADYAAAGGNPTLLAAAYTTYATAMAANNLYAPTQFYARLCSSTPSVISTLSSITGEPSGPIYTAQLIERSNIGFPTKDITPGGNYRVSSKVITWTASGSSIGPVTNAYLATTADNSGKLIAFRALSMTRTILDGDSMTLQIKLDLG